MKRPPVLTVADIEEAQTGRDLDPDAFEKARRDRHTLELQTIYIARRLERIGLKMRQGKHAVLGLYSGEVKEEAEYRNCNMLPVVQARNTHDMLKSVQYYLDATGANKNRMWVLSWGWVSLFDYREQHKQFTRAISKLSKHKLMERYGVSFAYYSIENTLHWVTTNGEPCDPKTPGAIPMLNLHAHAIVTVSKFAGSEGWRRFMQDVKLVAPKGYLHDSKIQKAAEVVKYVFKPSEFDDLNDMQLGALFQATTGLRFHTPLGNLRDFRKGLKDDRLKLKRIEGPKGGEWVLVKARSRNTDDKERVGDSPTNIPVGITTPSPAFNETFEPCLIIKEFDGNLDAFFAANPWIEERMASIRRTVERRRFASMKHTTTITVPDFETSEAPDWQPDTPPPPEIGDYLGLEIVDYSFTPQF